LSLATKRQAFGDTAQFDQVEMAICMHFFFSVKLPVRTSSIPSDLIASVYTSAYLIAELGNFSFSL
jgi:hypothetical protein